MTIDIEAKAREMIAALLTQHVASVGKPPQWSAQQLLTIALAFARQVRSETAEKVLEACDEFDHETTEAQRSAIVAAFPETKEEA